MATTTTHCKMGIVDSLGNVNVLYPQTTGADVSITPNSVVSATTVQGLVDSLKGSAFLSNFTGIDDSSTTSTTATYSAKKISALNSDLVSANQTLKTLVVSVPSFNSLPQTITNSNIDDDMVAVNSVLSNPSAQTGDWTVTTSNGSLTISGSISGSTTATLYLTRSR